MAEDAINEPVRKLQLTFSQLPSTSAHLSLPCLGLDFGSVFVRLALLRNSHAHAQSESANNCHLLVDLLTYTTAALPAALHYAKQQCDSMTDLKVYYTGHQHQQLHQQLQQAFPNAVTIAHRDKLECHNKGAHFLVSSDLPDEQLFHDTSSAEMQVSRDLSARIDVMKLMFPPKMLEVFGILTSQLQSKSQCRFPLTLSILGSNNIVCCLSGDQLFKVVDSRCCGPNGILALWAKVQPENSAMEFGEFLQLAEKGNRRNVDSLTNEIAESKGFYSGMPNDYPVFDLGKMENLRRDQVASEDLARAVLGFNTDQIMAKAKDLSLLEQAFPIYFVGSFVQLEFVRSELLLRSHSQLIPGMPKPKFFKTDATAALGACFA